MTDQCVRFRRIGARSYRFTAEPRGVGRVTKLETKRLLWAATTVSPNASWQAYGRTRNEAVSKALDLKQHHGGE